MSAGVNSVSDRSATLGRCAVFVALLSVGASHAWARGEVIVTTGDELGGRIIHSTYESAINNLGEVVFRAVLLTGTPNQEGIREGILKADGTVVAAVGDVIEGHAVYRVSNPSINDFGDVVFVMSFEANSKSAIVLSSDGERTVLAASGMTLAGKSIQWVWDPCINNAGQVVFQARWTEQGLPREGILDREGNVVFRRGAQIGGLTARELFSPCINNAGDVAFGAWDTSAGGAGIFLADGMMLINASGAVIAGKSLEWLDFRGFDLNDSGALAILGGWIERDRHGNETWWTGLFRTDGVLVAMTGEAIGGQVIEGWFGPASPAINNFGDVTFSAHGTNPEGDVQYSLFGVTVEDQYVDTAELIADLIIQTDAVNANNGIQSSLDAKLDAAIDAFTAENADQRQDALHMLDAFQHEVDAQRGRQIDEADADRLLRAADVVLLRVK